MTHLNNSKSYNELDYYLLIFKDTKEVYEKFRIKSTAKHFLYRHPLKEDLELITNPKYVIT